MRTNNDIGGYGSLGERMSERLYKWRRWAEIVAGGLAGLAMVAYQLASETDLTTGLRDRTLSQEEAEMAMIGMKSKSADLDFEPDTEYSRDEQGRLVRKKTYYEFRTTRDFSHPERSHSQFYRDVVKKDSFDPKTRQLVERSRKKYVDSGSFLSGYSVAFKPGKKTGKRTTLEG